MIFAIFMIAFLEFCNANFCITVSTFSAALSAVLASQSPISIFDSPSRLSKVLWGLLAALCTESKFRCYAAFYAARS